MMSITSLTLLASAVLFGATPAAADPIPAPASLASRQYNTLTYEGCYSSSAGLTYNTTGLYNTKGYCQTVCAPGGSGYSVQATTNKKDCWCGNEVPPSSAKVSDSFCNDPCAGYSQEMCGSAGSKYLSVYLTGSGTVDSDSSAATSSSASSASTTPSSTTSAKPSVVTVQGTAQTVMVTTTSSANQQSSASSSKSSGGPNKAGIAAGVVVGVLAIAAIAGGVFLFVRSKKRRQVEEEYQRNAAVASFVANGKPPASSGGGSFTDTRLDPVMAQRRVSDGSIADNQDYSRRILQVTNA